MSGPSKGIGRAEVALRWDPSPAGEPDVDLDLVAATYTADDPSGTPAYLVHSGSRSPDGTITLSRESGTGQGFGFDEVMTFEFDRLAERYTRVLVGVVIQRREGGLTFGRVGGTRVKVSEGYDELASDELAGVAGASAATVAEFRRDEAGRWVFRPLVRGFDADPEEFTRLMGGAAA